MGAFPRHFMPRASFWAIDPDIPALLHPEYVREESAAPPEMQESPTTNWVIVELDSKIIREKMLPEMVERYFGGTDGLVYDVALINRSEPNSVLYTTNPQLGASNDVQPDARLRIFGGPFAQVTPPMEPPPATRRQPGEPRMGGQRPRRAPGAPARSEERRVGKECAL